MSLKSFKEVGLKLNSIFQTIHQDEDIFIQNIHRIKLIKKIIQKFISMRILHLRMQKNERKKPNLRQKSNKLVLFNNE